jgi:XTP/dITP diphosphohydrolase
MLLYTATSNPGKLRDFAHAAERHRDVFTILPLPNLSNIPAPPEDEATFDANARGKAVYYSRYAPGQFLIADDSGLEVPALGGAPGVRSARYAQDQNHPPDPSLSLDQANNAVLVANLATVAPDRRQASYRCALALARDGEILRTAEGRLDGILLSEPRGSAGFGYDPLFYLPEHGVTMAEIEPELRIQVSHRGRALEALLRQLSAPGPVIAPLVR